MIDAGAGTAAHRAANGFPCVTISLDLKFISTTRLGQEIIGFTKILKKTKSKEKKVTSNVEKKEVKKKPLTTKKK